jgi:hypothetical protein
MAAQREALHQIGEQYLLLMRAVTTGVMQIIVCCKLGQLKTQGLVGTWRALALLGGKLS